MMNGDVKLLERAAQNIAKCIGIPASRTVYLLCSPSTTVIATAVEAVLQRRDLTVRTMVAVVAKQPFTLQIKNGRVATVDELDQSDHCDVSVLQPTMEVDGKVICRNGAFGAYAME